MKRQHSFRPDCLGPLESRLALSGAAMAMPAMVAPTAGIRATANAPADRDTRTFEISFLTGMIPHHRMAIDMSKLAVRYASDPQVKALAKQIIGEQAPEIAPMNRYLAVDGVRNYNPGKAPSEIQDLKTLGSQRGAAFDRAFLTMMIDHHTMAIQGNDIGMVGASQAQTRAAQPGIRALAANIVATQSREIDEMQGILARLRGSSSMS